MPLERFKRNHARRIATIADAGGLIMTLIYLSYVSMMLIFDVGYKVLNFCMLGITAAYILFLAFKMLYLNRFGQSGKIKRTTKRIYRYGKYTMRIINAVFVILAIVNVQISDSHIVPVIGIIVLVMTFIITVAFDLIMYFIKKKVREIRLEWQNLGSEGKKEKIDFFIDSFIKGLDNISGFDEYVEVGKEAGRKLGGRFRPSDSDSPAESGDIILLESGQEGGFEQVEPEQE